MVSVFMVDKRTSKIRRSMKDMFTHLPVGQTPKSNKKVRFFSSCGTYCCPQQKIVWKQNWSRKTSSYGPSMRVGKRPCSGIRGPFSNVGRAHDFNLLAVWPNFRSDLRQTEWVMEIWHHARWIDLRLRPQLFRLLWPENAGHRNWHVGSMERLFTPPPSEKNGSRHLAANPLWPIL